MAIQQMSNPLRFSAFFTDSSGVGRTGLTVMVDVYRDDVQIVTNGAAAAIGGGLYSYTLAAANTGAPGQYIAMFKTTDTTVAQRHLAAVWTVGTGWVGLLDAAVSTRLAASAYTAPPGASAIADAVWDEPIAGALTDSTRAALVAAGAAGDPLASPVPGAYPPGTAGAQIARIGSAQVGVSSPVAVTGRVTLHQGKDYHAADGTALAWTIASPIDLTGAAVTFDFAGVQCAGLVSGSAGEWVVRVNLAAAALALVPTGVYPYELVAVLANGRTAPPLAVGTVEVRAEV